jgi:hypothetical protein
VDIGNGSSGSVEDAEADGKFDVAETERGTERVRRGGLSIFPGTIEVEEGNISHVHDSALKG